MLSKDRALRTFDEHSAWVRKGALSSEGRVACSAAQDGTVVVRPSAELPLEEIMAHIAEKRILREFTCAEREQYRILPLCAADGVAPESGN